MAIDDRHPGVFAYGHGPSRALWVAADGHSGDEVVASWRAFAAWARARQGPRWFAAVCVLVAFAVVCVVVRLIRPGASLGTYALVAPVAAVAGGLLHGALHPRLFPGARSTPPRRLAAVPLAAELWHAAPADTPAAQLASWNGLVVAYRQAAGELRKGRADAQLTPKQRYVAPGDRSTWFYSEVDLPELHRRYTQTRAAAQPVADELGFTLDPL